MSDYRFVNTMGEILKNELVSKGVLNYEEVQVTGDTLGKAAQDLIQKVYKSQTIQLHEV